MSSNNKKIAVYPGTFDPITNGHKDVITRAATHLADHLIVAVASNIGKNPLFTLEERQEMVQEEVNSLPSALSKKIEVCSFGELLMDFVTRKEATFLVRGLRAVSDFEYEFQMAVMNSRLNKNVETVFLMASEHHQFISSRFVKEIGRLGGDISEFVSPPIQKRLNKRSL